MNEPFRFERLSSENLFHLIRLYKLCFSTKTDIEFLKKKYNTAKFGASHIGFLAFDTEGGEAVGYYGVFPIKCVTAGKELLAAQSGDTMTHPKYQGKGLFTKLARMTYDLAKSEGVDFVFGFPNNNSYPGFIKKLEWQHVDDMNHYVIKTGAIPLDKLAKKITLVKIIYDKYINLRLKSILSNKKIKNSTEILDTGKGYVLHDNNFFEYKNYFKTYTISIHGIESIIKIDGRLWVGDMNVKNELEIQKAISDLVKLGRKLLCSTVRFSVHNNSYIDKILSKEHPISSTIPVGYLNLSGNFDPSNFAFQAVDFDTF